MQRSERSRLADWAKREDWSYIGGGGVFMDNEEVTLCSSAAYVASEGSRKSPSESRVVCGEQVGVDNCRSGGEDGGECLSLRIVQWSVEERIVYVRNTISQCSLSRVVSFLLVVSSWAEAEKLVSTPDDSEKVHSRTYSASSTAIHSVNYSSADGGSIYVDAETSSSYMRSMQCSAGILEHQQTSTYY